MQISNTTSSQLHLVPISQHVVLPEQPLIEFCQQWQIDRLALFGSVLRPDFNPQISDIDILVDFDEAARHTLLDFVEMQDQLTEIFGRKVDLVSRKGIENSQNQERRRNILSSAQTIYDTRSTTPARHAELNSTGDELPLR